MDLYRRIKNITCNLIIRHFPNILSRNSFSLNFFSFFRTLSEISLFNNSLINLSLQQLSLCALCLSVPLREIHSQGALSFYLPTFTLL